MSDSTRAVSCDDLLQRVCGEFIEMPGLQVTPAQAQRLWGLDEWTCAEVLQRLVDSGFLCRSARGTYARATANPVRSDRLPSSLLERSSQLAS